MKKFLINTKYGNLEIITSGKKIVKLLLNDKNKTRCKNNISADRNIQRIISLLQQYFDGKKVNFRVEVDLSNLTFFTQKVLRATQTVRYGETSTYSDIAKKIGHPKASRAVGRALGLNPIPVIIPCHRIIRKDNSLGGFTYGLQWKKKLLNLES